MKLRILACCLDSLLLFFFLPMACAITVSYRGLVFLTFSLQGSPFLGCMLTAIHCRGLNFRLQNVMLNCCEPVSFDSGNGLIDQVAGETQGRELLSNVHVGILFILLYELNVM